MMIRNYETRRVNTMNYLSNGQAKVEDAKQFMPFIIQPFSATEFLHARGRANIAACAKRRDC